jgi:hypothetical protein
MRYVRLILQHGIALILLATGLGKLLDVPGFVQVLATYQALPVWLLRPVAVAFVVLELRLAEWLLSGKRLSHAALASVALHSAFTAWSIVALLRGLNVPNCGCFGVFWARPLTWGTVGEDLFLVAISWGLYALARSRSTRPEVVNPLTA